MPTKKSLISTILDAIILAVLSIISIICTGYLLNILTVWFLIPMSVQLSPALDAALTKIGEEHDPEAIYSAIRAFCMLAGAFPGMYFANASMRGREREFVHDTGGMIRALDGLKYHARRHLISDLAGLLTTAIIGLLLHAFGIPQVSPFAGFYSLFGLPIGLILSIILTIFAHVFGVLMSQNTWRARAFYGA